ncbi:MAG: VCBS repeat-containing protein [Pyrinomonadaceae bacterium]
MSAHRRAEHGRLRFTRQMISVAVLVITTWAAQPLHGSQKSLPGQKLNFAIAFENIVDRSGINFILDNGRTPYKHQIETMTGGVAVFDYNNDGLLDIYFANGARLPEMDKSQPRFFNRLYRNKGNGKFDDVTASAGVKGDGLCYGRSDR